MNDMIDEAKGRRVLDHGLIRLVESMGSDLSVVRSARVSFNAAWRTGEDAGKDEKLIRYLMNNRHTTPFESVAFTFDVKAPIFVFRQWHRHRTWSYNEISARYTELPEEFYVPEPSAIGVQATSSKQAREIDGAWPVERSAEIDAYRSRCRDAFSTYRFLMVRGWPRELARMCLPVSTYSQMFASVDLHNLFHFLMLRLHPHAQYEIRVYAEAILELIRSIAPATVAAWEAYRARVMESEKYRAVIEEALRIVQSLVVDEDITSEKMEGAFEAELPSLADFLAGALAGR